MGELARIHVDMYAGAVFEDGHPVHLTKRQAQMLFSLAASSAGMHGSFIPSDVATRVLVNRVRGRFRGEVIRTDMPGRYALAEDVLVNVREMLCLSILLPSTGLAPHLEAVQRLRFSIRSLPANPHRGSPWFAQIESELRALAKLFLEIVRSLETVQAQPALHQELTALWRR